MSLARFALAQAGQALIRAMSKTTHEGKGCACIAYLCTIVRICPTLLPSCELCSWLAFAALGTFPTAPLFFGTFSAAAAVRVASFPCGRSKFGFRFRNATFETPQKICPGVGGRGRSPLIRPGAPWPCPCRTAVLSSP